jgi:glutathione peroxidase-family protein
MRCDRPDWVIDDSRRNRRPLPTAFDLQGDIARASDDSRVIPTTFLIDTQGRVVKRYIGAPDFAELPRRIEALLAS